MKADFEVIDVLIDCVYDELNEIAENRYNALVNLNRLNTQYERLKNEYKELQKEEQE